MRTKAFRLSFILLIALLLLLPLVSLGAAPNNQGPEGGDVANVPVSPLKAPEGVVLAPKTAELAAAHVWTAEEMKNAIPYPIPTVDEKDLANVGAAPSVDGAAGMIPGGAPEDAQALELGTGADLSVVNSAGLLGYSYPGPFARYYVGRVAPVTYFPWRTVGKLYFRQRDATYPYTARSYVASAESIGNYAIWTAGHCVHNGSNRSDGWSFSIQFVPAKTGASAPYGIWTGRVVATMSAWYSSAQLGRDEGVIGLYLLNNLKISQRVGWLGFAWNWSYQQAWTEVGYPAAAPFDGTLMYAVNSSYAYADGSRSPATQGVGNDLTPGCSGGPWILSFGYGNYANGVNSYRYTNHPLEMYSPHYDTLTKNLWDTAQAWHP